MKITLEYDEATLFLTDKAGIQIAAYAGLVSFEQESSNKDVIDLIKLGVDLSLL